jgi:isopentenyl diphosphate isomerase/L-lactate dehydrogenase-like FMN-dependent dehydrogenase
MTGEAPETAAEGQVGSASEPLGRVLSLADFEPLAERLMDRAAFDYIAGGSGAEITLRDNIEAFPRRCLRPRVLVDVSEIDLSTDVLGTRVALPVGVAPMAFQHLAHTDAEAGMARAAAQAGALFCLSTMSSLPLETVASSADEVETAASGVPGTPPRWFQLYVHRDRGVSADLVARAEVAGYSAIVLTVDLPVAGYRERDMRNQLAYPERFGNFEAGSLGGRPIVEVIAGFNERALTWSDVGWLRGLTRLPVVVKGVMTAEDAALAVTHGATTSRISDSTSIVACTASSWRPPWFDSQTAAAP